MANRYNYATISTFGCNTVSPSSNPLVYCLNNGTSHLNFNGSSSVTLGPNSPACERYMSQYCADNWNDVCESLYTDPRKPLTSAPYIDGQCSPNGKLTVGQKLLYDTASRKYLVEMRNAVKKSEPFDPNVSNSPLITYWTRINGSGAVPIYEVNPETIDSDRVMDHMLEDPVTVLNILINIYNTMKRKGTLKKLKGTKLGNFYEKSPFFDGKK